VPGDDALQRVVIDLAERPAQRGRGGHLAEQVTLVAQHIDTTHGLPPLGEGSVCVVTGRGRADAFSAGEMS
jgi:hypothetical protein